MQVSPTLAEEQNLLALADVGIDVLATQSPPETVINGLLPEPSPGETYLGVATQNERSIFRAFCANYAKRLYLYRQGFALRLSLTAQELRSVPLDSVEPVQARMNEIAFATDDDRLEYFRTLQREELLRYHLYWSIGERFSQHDHHLHMRTGYTIYRGHPR